MNLATTMMFGSDVLPQDTTHKAFPNDLNKNKRQETRTSLHRHGHHTVCVDFDGVIADYNGYMGRGWIGAPKPEGLELLNRLNQMGYIVVVLTARQELEIVGKWLVQHGVGFAQPTNTKPPAVAYFDDRAIAVDGDTPVENLLSQLKDLDKNWSRHPRPGV